MISYVGGNGVIQCRCFDLGNAERSRDGSARLLWESERLAAMGKRFRLAHDPKTLDCDWRFGPSCS
jgi:hypothetical protein